MMPSARNPIQTFSKQRSRLKLAPERAIVVGDSPYDAEAAGKAGLKTIGVLCGGFAEADLRKAGAAQIFRDPADLLANFERSLICREESATGSVR